MAALVSVAEQAAAQYREFARRLRREAYEAAATGRPVEAQRLRYLAMRTEHAADAELAPRESLS